MAIAKMLRMSLVGVGTEQEKLLDALHKTGAVQLKTTEDFDKTEKVICDKSEISDKQDEVENSLSLINSLAKESGAKGDKLPIADGFGVSYSDFMAVKAREDEILKVAEEVKSLNDRITKNKAEIIALHNEIDSYKPYEGLNAKFSDFAPTLKTVTRLGVMTDSEAEKAKTAIGESENTYFEVLTKSEKGLVVAAIALSQDIQTIDKILSEHAFLKCPFSEDIKASDKIAELKNRIDAITAENEKLKNDILNFVDKTYDLKLLSDFLTFEKEKAFSSDNFGRTKTTFILEAYVPKERREEVENAAQEVSGNVYLEFEELGEEDYAPTLMKNKKVASQFEFVTNMYSAPKYLSFDPNTVIAFFFSIFLGFITADAGYGILLAVGGFVFAATAKRKSGMTKLANVIAWGGLATIVFGILFDSFFGVPLLQNLHLIKKPIMPDPIVGMSELAGISIPTLLLISLGMGVIHIMAGLFINALISFRHGKIFDGICDGFIWIVFLAGLLLLAISMIGIIPDMTSVAAIIMIVAVVLGALTAGRHVKGFGKFTKGFGAVYGLINYASDILSYARLYGLMLSGAQIAQIISCQLALPMIDNVGGFAGVILCGLIMIFGHAFNIAMGVLGAFIHDARLQYVEFFSHFYEGDGDLFIPLGSKFNHIYLK